jgi:ubiquinone/menaquinone biosynthesis C-methylase UbiE
MLEIRGPRARWAVGVDISVPALRLARTRVHGAGLAHCEFRRGDMYSLPFDDACFDTVSIDRVLASAERPAAAIAEAARTLRPDGRLIIVEDFDQIDARAGDNPLSQLRRWFAAAGMSADRLRPCDLGARHFILALAHHRHRTPHLVDPQQLAGLA